MRNVPGFNALIENAMMAKWDNGAPTDYKGAILQNRGFARKTENKCVMIDKYHIKHDEKKRIMWPMSCDRNVRVYGHICILSKRNIVIGQFADDASMLLPQN